MKMANDTPRTTAPTYDEVVAKVVASKSYFPIRILLKDTGREMICAAPSDIPNGQPFFVLECQDAES